MIKVGLTGNIGSGKSVVSAIFEILHVPVYRSDEEAKAILDKPETIHQIVQTFTDIVLDDRGKINRKKLAAIVFNDATKLKKLNGIIHPAVSDDFSSWVSAHDDVPVVIMESAILFETGFNELFDKIIVISAPEDTRIQRVMKRDGISREDVEARINRQLPEHELISKADFIIDNFGETLVIPQVLEICLRLKSSK